MRLRKELKNVFHAVLSVVRSFVMIFKEEKKVAVPVPVNSNELLKGKVALITGGSGGIGMAIAKSYLKNGCKVIIAGTSEEKLKESCQKLCEVAGAEVAYQVINVLDTTTMSEKIQMAASKFDENRIDILVNSAGILNSSNFYHTTEEEYDRVMDVNVKGTYFMCQAMGQYMIDREIKGHILNVSSSSALRPAWTPYQISKWAIRGFTLGLADTLLPHGIIVNAIAPGPVATPMLGKEEGDNLYNPSCPIGRYALPEEIANLATFMVSDMGDMIVGDSFYMTGGAGTISYKI